MLCLCFNRCDNVCKLAWGLPQDMVQSRSRRGSKAAQQAFQEAADSLWSSHLEVEVAGLRAGTSVSNGSGDLGASIQPDEDRMASCQWALQSCRCLIKVVTSKLGVRVLRMRNCDPLEPSCSGCCDMYRLQQCQDIAVARCLTKPALHKANSAVSMHVSVGSPGNAGFFRSKVHSHLLLLLPYALSAHAGRPAAARQARDGGHGPHRLGHRPAPAGCAAHCPGAAAAADGAAGAAAMASARCWTATGVSLASHSAGRGVFGPLCSRTAVLVKVSPPPERLLQLDPASQLQPRPSPALPACAAISQAHKQRPFDA